MVDIIAVTNPRVLEDVGAIPDFETMDAELSDMKGTGWTDGMKKCSVSGVRETESRNPQP